MRQKEKQRRIAKRTGEQKEFDKFQALRQKAKTLIDSKYKKYMSDLKSSLKENPKHFWTFVKAKSKSSFTPGFLKHCRN